MSVKESRVSRTCLNPGSSDGGAATSGESVHGADMRRIGTRCSPARCTTWATWPPTGRGTWLSPTRSIAVPDVANTSTWTSGTWPIPTATTPGVSWRWRSAWWSKTACPIAPHPGTYGETIGSSSPSPRSRTGWKRGEKRAADRITQDYLDDALSDFSGYIAADELYDGPYCVLSIVDNHRFNRLIYEVLDHSPTEEDITAFFTRFKEVLAARGLALKAITTDGSPLYPTPIAQVFGAIPHQVCQFHVIAEINKAVLKAVAKVRRQLKASRPKLGRGRPSAATRKLAARKKRLEQRITDLFVNRHLFVQHHLTPAERKTLQRITRGWPELRTLRQIVDEVYRLFDRRCRTDTALAKLAKLRQRVRRFQAIGQTLKKLFSPTLEKSLVFLDDSLLPPTSNAVERGNRRHRKMQKTIYRVRTGQHIRQRIAMDMLRDAQAQGRLQTTQTLHYARAG